MQSIIDFLSILLDKILSNFLCPIKYLYYYIAQLIVDLVNGLNASELNTAINAISISGDLGYWFNFFAIKECFGIMSAAYTIRFAIRRIPFFN